MQPQSPLRASLRRRRRALASHLKDAVTGDSHAVHQARVATRRLRETLPVVAAGLEGDDVRKLRRRTRRLTRVLGVVRELEVAIGMTEPQAADGSASAADATDATAATQSRRAAIETDTLKGRDYLKKQLTSELEQAREGVTKVLDADKIGRWLDKVEEVEETLARKREQAAWRRELATRLERRAAMLMSALDQAGVLFVAERLHEVRIALKRLRYALELAGELRVANTAASVRELKAVQDILGALHDHDVLMGHTAAASEDPDLDRATRASLLALHGTLETERHQLHAQFLSHRPALLRLHDRAIEIAARARTRRVSETSRAKTHA
jgi:CHAD domain-containing protein